MERRKAMGSDTVFPSLALPRSGSRGRWSFSTTGPSSQPKFQLPQRPRGRLNNMLRRTTRTVNAPPPPIRWQPAKTETDAEQALDRLLPQRIQHDSR